MAVSIRRCTEADVDEVMRFIDDHWRKAHVLTQNRALFDWQHACGNGIYNFLLAWDEAGLLLGILGYIPASRYDPLIAAADDLVWLALWKTRPDAGRAGLGLALLRELGRLHPGAQLGVNGINVTHPPMYRSLGFQSDELRQYYLTNPDSSGDLIGNIDGQVLPVPRPGIATFKELDAAALARLTLPAGGEPVAPLKSPAYFIRRFLDHPFYAYRVLSVELEGETCAILATRVDQHGSSRALRIVDFWGDEQALAQCGTALREAMNAVGAQYTDFWQFGLSEQHLLAAGFAATMETGPAVPTYFEPFVSTRARIFFAIKAGAGRTPRVFKADGDQDRPNRIGVAL